MEHLLAHKRIFDFPHRSQNRAGIICRQFGIACFSSVDLSTNLTSFENRLGKAH
jgi:hypothetical protein